MDKEIEQLAERLIEREIYCRANTVIETLNTHGLIECDLWENEYENQDGENDGDPNYKEIYEYYFVSDWLADKLFQVNEPILRCDLVDFPVWGRTCTGQSISLDGTFQEIAKMISKDSEAAYL